MPSDCQGTVTSGTNYCVKQPKFQNVGKDPDSVLGMCSGDCDTDDDCDSGLQCAQNNDDIDISGLPCVVCESFKVIQSSLGRQTECKKLPNTSEDFPLCRVTSWSYTESSSLNSCSGKVSVGINTTI